MLKLGGALCTFAFESHPRDLPLYDHRNLRKCFGALDDHIRMHLETIVPTQYLEIPLVKRADFFYESEVTDQRCLDRARWIFARALASERAGFDREDAAIGEAMFQGCSCRNWSSARCRAWR